MALQPFADEEFRRHQREVGPDDEHQKRERRALRERDGDDHDGGGGEAHHAQLGERDQAARHGTIRAMRAVGGEVLVFVGDAQERELREAGDDGERDRVPTPASRARTERSRRTNKRRARTRASSRRDWRAGSVRFGIATAAQRRARRRPPSRAASGLGSLVSFRIGQPAIGGTGVRCCSSPHILQGEARRYSG